jgi:hypothetical protein
VCFGKKLVRLEFPQHTITPEAPMYSISVLGIPESRNSPLYRFEIQFFELFIKSDDRIPSDSHSTLLPRGGYQHNELPP